MKRSQIGKLVATSLASLGLMLPQSIVLAADGTASPARTQPVAPVAVDVALGNGGLLHGQVVNAQGKVVKAAAVSVWHDGQQVAKTTADDNGQFAVAGLRGGVHAVVAGQGQGVYRLWTAQTAPPSARPSAVVVSEKVIRANDGDPITSALTSPLLWGIVGYTAGHVIGFNQGLDHGSASN